MGHRVGWPHTHLGQKKFGRDTLAVNIPPEEQGGLTQILGLQLRVPMPGREVILTSGYETSLHCG